MILETAPTVFDLSLYIPELKPRKKEGVLAEMVGLAHQAGVVRGPGVLLELLRLLERVGNTGLGKGVAIPHARSATVVAPRLVVARSQRGIEWGAADGLSSTLILLALAPAEWSAAAYHAFVGRAVAAARLQRNRQRLLSAASFDAVAAVLREVTA